MDFADIGVRSALVSSRRDLDAPRRAWEDPNPKTRMLGPTPVIFFRVDAPKAPKQVFGDPLIYSYRICFAPRTSPARVFFRSKNAPHVHLFAPSTPQGRSERACFRPENAPSALHIYIYIYI